MPDFTDSRMDEIELNAQRYLEFSYVVNGSPLNPTHAARLERAKLAAKQAIKSQTSGSKDAELKVEENIKLSCPDRNGWIESVATFDTGANDNWIAESVVEKLEAIRQNVEPDFYITFTGEVIKSDKEVRNITWGSVDGHQTRVTNFRIAPANAKFKVLFGKELIGHEKIYEYCPKSAQVLTKLPQTKDGKKKAVAKEATVETESAALEKERIASEGSGGYTLPVGQSSGPKIATVK